MPALLPLAPCRNHRPHIATFVLCGLFLNPCVLARTDTTHAVNQVNRVTASGDTLWDIAGDLHAGPMQYSATRQQIMYAILRKNPEAFIGGNIHFLKRGVTLAAPTPDEARAEVASEVEKHFKQHETHWLKRKRPVPSAASPYPLPASRDLSGELPAPPVSHPQSQSVEPPVATAPTTNAPLQSVPKTVDPSTRPHQINEPLSTVSLQDSGVRSLTAYIAILIFVLGIGLGWLFSRRRVKAPAAVSVPPADLNKVLPKVTPVGNLVFKPGTPDSLQTPDHLEAAIKLLVGEAYLELGRQAEARTIIQEAAQEGNTTTRAAAATLIGKLAASTSSPPSRQN